MTQCFFVRCGVMVNRKKPRPLRHKGLNQWSFGKTDGKSTGLPTERRGERMGGGGGGWGERERATEARAAIKLPHLLLSLMS